ncbi:mannose-specific lectin-like [Zingiber officinale]|uniref:Bulb-type lectin domain-containing protein n=1 Tax=Zingiber officinale TaxID=94328 RepID=A0A8J5FVG1_ZINOF|nr:mannose-specific lectin-like [Zingiber officinale]KAG6495873.1 hypothetical protein ZIOFF_043703 [Zingiber officinale]
MASLVMLSAALLLGLLLPFSMADNVLLGGDRLKTGESLTEGDFSFDMQFDCNLVLYDNGQPVWSPPSNGLGNSCFAYLQTNGNFVIYNGNGQVVWTSNTAGEEGNYILVLQRDGNVVIYSRPIFTIPPNSKGVVMVKRGHNHELVNRKIAMETKN